MKIRAIRSILIGALLINLLSVPSKAGGALATIGLTPGWVTFGQVLPSGAAYNELQVGSFPTQTDVKVRWPDGSIRFAVVTAHIDTAGYFPLTETSPQTGSFSPTIPSATVKFNIGGADYLATLPNQTTNDLWLSGPLVREFRSVLAPMGPGNVPHLSLRVIFDTRVFNSGESRVTVTVENAIDLSQANTVTYDLNVVANSQTVFTKTAVDHYMFCSWKKAFPLNGLQESIPTPDFEPIFKANAIPRYLNSAPNNVYSTEGPGFEIFGKGGNSYAYMGATGGRPELGLYPESVAVYTVNKAVNQRDYILATGDLAVAWPVRIRNPNGKRISIDEIPDYWYDYRWPSNMYKGPVAGNNLVNIRWSPLKPDNAHVPSLAYVPYLLTGDRTYADAMADWADFGLLSTSPVGREGTRGIMQAQDVRAFAWAFRNMIDVALYLPDGDSTKAYYLDKVRKNLIWLDANSQCETLGFLSFWANKNWPKTDADPLHVIGTNWEQEYLALVIDHANLGGLLGGEKHKIAIVKFTLAMFADLAWRIYACPARWRFGTRRADGSIERWYTTWEEMRQENGWDTSGTGATPFGGYYGPEARLMLMIAIRDGIDKAAAWLAYDYLWPFLAVHIQWNRMTDLVMRPAWGLAFDDQSSIGNRPPVVYGGPNQNLGVAPVTATLKGSAVDDGLPARLTDLDILWRKISGPGNVKFSNPTSAVTDIAVDQDGIYVLRITASDTELKSHHDVTVRVNMGSSKEGPGGSDADLRGQIVKGNDRAELRFTVEKMGSVEMVLYNRLGKVETTIKQDVSSGENTVSWDMKDLPSGIYPGYLNLEGKIKKFKIVHIR